MNFFVYKISLFVCVTLFVCLSNRFLSKMNCCDAKDFLLDIFKVIVSFCYGYFWLSDLLVYLGLNTERLFVSAAVVSISLLLNAWSFQQKHRMFGAFFYLFISLAMILLFSKISLFNCLFA